MYNTLIIPKKHSIFSASDMEKLVQRVTLHGATVKKGPDWVELHKEAGVLRVAFKQTESLSAEIKELLSQFAIPFSEVDGLFELEGDDVQELLFKEYLLIIEHLRDTLLFCILDTSTGELTGKNTPLNEFTLHEFIAANAFITDLDKQIASNQQAKFNLGKNTYQSMPSRLFSTIRMVESAGIRTLEELVEALHAKQAQVLAMANQFVAISDTIYLGTCSRYLSIELIAATRNEEKITEFVKDHINSETYKKISKAIYKIYA